MALPNEEGEEIETPGANFERRLGKRLSLSSEARRRPTNGVSLALAARQPGRDTEPGPEQSATAASA